MKKTGIAGIFAASLELVKDGAVHILQKNYLRKYSLKRNLKL